MTSSERLAEIPEVPTIAETVAPGFDVRPWFGLAAPAGTPRPVLDRVNAEVRAVLRTPAVAERLRREGAESPPWSPAEFEAFMRRDRAFWDDLIRPTGIRVE